jgi:hypothetical protein
MIVQGVTALDWIMKWWGRKAAADHDGSPLSLLLLTERLCVAALGEPRNPLKK